MGTEMTRRPATASQVQDLVCVGVSMSEEEIPQISADLLLRHPEARIKVAPDGGELVAEIEPKRAVAVIERSRAHFTRTRTAETYRVLREGSM